MRLQSHKGMVGRAVRLHGTPTHPSSHPVSRGVRSRSGGGTRETWEACIALLAIQASSIRKAGRGLCREKRREEATAVLSWDGEGCTRCPDPQGCRRPAGVTGRATWVVSQFEFSVLRFLYGPRFVGCAWFFSIKFAMSSILHRVFVTPAAIAGDMRTVLWIREKLYQTK
jgi:hypothetical protein